MGDRAILLFAYHFPPENAIGAYRAFRFYKFLKQLGYRVQVVTASKPDGTPPPDVTYVADPFVGSEMHGMGWQFERILRKLLVPGASGSQWSFLAWRAAQDFVARNHGSRITVISSFPPLGVLLAAWRLAKTANLKWIADFRDPINWHLPDDQPDKNTFLKKCEAAVIGRADLIICNTDTVTARWRRQFPHLRDRIQLIWNGFDPEERVAPARVPVRSYRLISHTGNLYAGRTVAPLVESMDRLVARGRLRPDRFRLQLVGAAEPRSLPSREVLERARAAGWLDVEPEVLPHNAALGVARASDGLLLVQPHSRLQVPGKIFEYIQIGSPVLAYIMHNSPIEEILRQSGTRYTSVYNDMPPEQMDQGIAGYIEGPFGTTPPNAWFEREFNGYEHARLLAEFVESLYARPARISET